MALGPFKILIAKGRSDPRAWVCTVPRSLVEGKTLTALKSLVTDRLVAFYWAHKNTGLDHALQAHVHHPDPLWQAWYALTRQDIASILTRRLQQQSQFFGSYWGQLFGNENDQVCELEDVRTIELTTAVDHCETLQFGLILCIGDGLQNELLAPGYGGVDWTEELAKRNAERL